jgi:hypothetical protein
MTHLDLQASRDDAPEAHRAPEAIHAADAPGSQGSTSLPVEHSPPFDLTSDMLFVMALARTGPLQQCFPRMPFFSLRGKTPLAIWFSRVKEACYGTGAGNRRCEGGLDATLYDEITVLVLLRQRAVFVPDIYATSDLSVRIARCYGMPKHLVQMTMQVAGSRVASTYSAVGGLSYVRARLWGSGKTLARMASLLWPLCTWPARFPSGRRIRALIQATPRAHVARIVDGQLALDAAWLPEAVPLLPLGLYVRDLRMRLPSP